MKLANLSNFISKLIALAFLFFFIGPISSVASADWSKSTSNPILDLGAAGTWEDTHVAAPFVTVENNNELIMWYDGHDGTRWSIGYATSNDNGATWQRSPDNPVLTFNPSDGQEQHLRTPAVLKDGNVYHMWYTSSPDDVSRFRIRYATSPDRVNWTKHGVVLVPTEPWESGGIAVPDVLKINDVYHMWYNAISGGIWRVGYATSTDGVNWTKHPSNPVFSPDGSEGNATSTGAIFFENGTFTRYYHAAPTGGIPTVIKKATSSDGVNWTRVDEENPILSRGSNGEFDDFLIAGPGRLIKINNTLHMYYSGHDGRSWRIGLATEDAALPSAVVPHFFQTDPQWADDEYDNANTWGTPPFTDMAALGCAVANAAMVLRFHGANMTPGNPDAGLPAKQLTPGTLNEWMRSRNDAYFRNGLTNWALIAALTHQVNQQDTNSPKLEYAFSSDPSTMDTLLAQNNPAILEIAYPPSPSSTHFVVATGKQNGDTTINDPFYTGRPTLAPHYTQINRVGSYTPTNSDFSYLIFAVDPKVDLELLDENGASLGQTFIQNPLADLVNETTSDGQPLKMLWVPKPSNGQYTLNVSTSTDTNYQLDTYAYDQEGNGGLQSFTGAVEQNGTRTYQVSFDAETAENTTVKQRITTDTLQNNITAAARLGYFKFSGMQHSLNSLMGFVTRLENRGMFDQAKIVLRSMQKQIDAFRGIVITEEGHQLLTATISSLLDSARS